MITPKVSVCIPSYNYGRYLKGCVDSVLAQTYKDFEIVLVDNASTDETAEIAGYFDDPRLHYFRNTSTVSAVDNHNKAFGLARGEYIALLAADDEFLPDRLLRCVEALDKYPRVGFVYSALMTIDARGATLETVRPYALDRIIPGKQEFASLVQENHIACPTVMFRNSLCRELGGFRAVRYTSDWDMWLRCTLRADVAYIAEPLALYRVHGESETAAFQRAGQVDLDLAWTVQSAFSAMPDNCQDLMYLQKQVLPRYCLPAAWRAFELGDLTTAQKYLESAMDADQTLSTDSARIADTIVHFCMSQRLSSTDPFQIAEDLCGWLVVQRPAYATVQRRVISGVHTAMAFEANRRGQPDEVRYHAIRAFAGNPAWLRNRGLLSVTLESVVGRSLMEHIRRAI